MREDIEAAASLTLASLSFQLAFAGLRMLSRHSKRSAVSAPLSFWCCSTRYSQLSALGLLLSQWQLGWPQ
jgi:hypothetical protein